MEVSRVITGNGRPIRPSHGSIACVEPDIPWPRTSESHGRWAVLHEIVAQLLTGQHLLVGPRFDNRIDLGITTRLVAQLVLETCVLRQFVLARSGPVGKRRVDSPRLQERGRHREIFATRDGDTAQPVSICAVAGRAIADERILLRIVGLAGDQLHGFVKAVVQGEGVVVIKLAQSGRIGECLVIAGYGVGDLVAEGEIEDELAITVG